MQVLERFARDVELCESLCVCLDLQRVGEGDWEGDKDPGGQVRTSLVWNRPHIYLLPLLLQPLNTGCHTAPEPSSRRPDMCYRRKNCGT